MNTGSDHGFNAAVQLRSSVIGRPTSVDVLISMRLPSGATAYDNPWVPPTSHSVTAVSISAVAAEGANAAPSVRDVVTLRTLASMEAYILGIPFWLTLVLGALTLLLTLSGLFSVLWYLVEQRTKEIGVRMALGATSRNIGALVLAQSARPVGLGLLLGASLTAALGAALLATPAAEQIGSAVRLFDPVAYAASLLCVVTACVCAALIPALRAGQIDPVAALKQE